MKIENESNKRQMNNRRTADSGGKLIFENPTLCSQLLRDYSGIELLKDIRPEDIEDVTERFIPMFTEERDADVVKKVHLAEGGEFFIALIEHKSGVDYNVDMQILRYMVYIWEDYENQMEGIHPGISHTKSFKYPPILPIVYYEDSQEWTAAETLSPRIALSDAFAEFIPDFRYHLISINSFGRDDLLERKDGLSLVMLLNRIRNAEELRKLNLPEDYWARLFEESPKDVLTVIARVIAVILRKINVPENDIQDLVDQIKERKNMALFDNFVADIDVQEERKKGQEIGEQIGEGKGEKLKVIKQVCTKMKKGCSIPVIADALEEDEAHIQEIYDVAIRYAPEYDAEEIFKEITDKKDC